MLFCVAQLQKAHDRHTSLPGGKLNAESKKQISKHIWYD